MFPSGARINLGRMRDQVIVLSFLSVVWITSVQLRGSRARSREGKRKRNVQENSVL